MNKINRFDLQLFNAALSARRANKMITKQEFSKTVRIYKSHSLKNGLISITYCDILGPNTISAEKTVVAEKHGGALNSLYVHEIG